MENCVTDYLLKRGYRVNTTALELIHACDDWYASRKIPEFHRRNTVQNVPYDLKQLNLAKRCCSDDANLCEILDVNAGSTEQQKDFVNAILADSEFQTQYRKQLEKVSADGTAACYVRLDDATIMKSGRVQGGRIRLNYVEAESYIPLTVENDVVTEAAFSGTGLEKGKKQTTLVIFTKDRAENYTAETAVFDEYGAKIEDKSIVLCLGNVKPFAVLQNAEVNNLDDMVGYGLPKLHNAIPALEVVELAFNVLYGDLDKADKLILINEMLCQFDGSGKPITPNEQAKKLFVLLGERLPTQKELIQEYNPEIRTEQITKALELALSLLSLMFGYGTKKYSFEGGQIKTATEYFGERQDSMQELNRQRQAAKRYIQDIVKAVLWFANTFQGGSWDLGADVNVEFDDSYITDKDAEMEQMRSDAVSFSDIPIFRIRYVMARLNCDEEQARQYIAEGQQDPDLGDETDD